MAEDIGIRHPEIKYTQVSPFYSDVFASLPLLVSSGNANLGLCGSVLTWCGELTLRSFLVSISLI